MAVEPDGTSSGESKLGVQVTGGGKAETIEVASDPQVKGRTAGRFVPAGGGDYTLTYTPSGRRPGRGPVARVVVGR
ncbi:MAG: hypothetical protein U0840_30865 [Gemmataceae bacterium]